VLLLPITLLVAVLQAPRLRLFASRTYELDGNQLAVGLVSAEPCHSKVATANVSYLQVQQHSRHSKWQQAASNAVRVVAWCVVLR
jgi:ribosomal protein L3